MLRFIYFLLVFSVAFIAKGQNQTEEKSIVDTSNNFSEVPQILFVSNFFNEALGYNHSGVIIEKTGRVSKYKDDHRSWLEILRFDYWGNFGVKEMNYLKEYLAISSYKKFIPIAFIDSIELSNIYQLLCKCEDANFYKYHGESEDGKIQIIMDAGIYYTYGIIYKENEGIYKKIPLMMSGELDGESGCLEADIIIDWLRNKIEKFLH